MGKIYEDDGSKYIFVAIDHFSKWIETRVLQAKTGKEIYKAIEELIIAKHGIPERILSDYGLEFENKLVQSLADKYNFEWEFGSPYPHQTTGAVERVNQTLRNTLRKICNYGEENWSPKLEAATLAVKFSYHRAIGTSPYILKYGKQMSTEIDKKLKVKEKIYNKQRLYEERNSNFERYKKSGLLHKTPSKFFYRGVL